MGIVVQIDRGNDSGSGLADGVDRTRRASAFIDGGVSPRE
jgi:hypothetical protein